MTKINTIILKKDAEIENNPSLENQKWISFENSEFDSEKLIENPYKNIPSMEYTNIPKENLKELLETGETAYLVIESTYVHHILNKSDDEIKMLRMNVQKHF